MRISSITGRKLSFMADVENWAEGMDYCAVPVPALITETLGTKGPVLVMAQLNNLTPFEVSLFPVGGGQHYIRIKAKIRQETGVQEGDRVQVRLTVLDRANLKIPNDLKTALASDNLMAAFKSLPPGKQNFAVRRINDTVKPQTREKRIQDAVIEAQQAKQKSTGKAAVQ